MFYFSWVSVEECFNAQEHGRMDLEVFELRLVHREGEYAFADVAVRYPAVWTIPEGKPYMLIWFKGDRGDVRPLFRGRVCPLPQKIRHHEGVFRLIATSLEGDRSLEELLQVLKQKPYWDPLFLGGSEEPEGDEVLEAREGLMYSDRWTHQVRLSGLSKGSQHYTLEDQFFQDSLKITFREPPFSAVQVSLSAEWTQTVMGWADLGPLIGAAFEGGLINTFTPQDFRQRWDRALSAFYRTGYQVECAQLVEVSPPFSGVLSPYPPLSLPVWQLKNPLRPFLGTEQVRLKRTWFQAILLISWFYRQRRRETLSFTLSHRTQQSLGTRGVKKLHFRLRSPLGDQHVQPWQRGGTYTQGDRVHVGGFVYQALCDHQAMGPFMREYALWKREGLADALMGTASSFFDTDRGGQALGHALERARSFLAYSARCIHVHVEVSFEQGWAITPDDTVSLKDPRLPGGTITGKVISYVLQVRGDTGVRTVSLTLAVTLGADDEGAVRVEESSWPLYVASDYMEADEGWVRSPSGLSLSIPPYTPEGLCHADWGAADLIGSLMVMNGARDQQERLRQETSLTRKRAFEMLKEQPTMIKIRLKDLREQGVLEHRIEAGVCGSWSGPAQLHKEGG